MKTVTKYCLFCKWSEHSQNHYLCVACKNDIKKGNKNQFFDRFDPAVWLELLCFIYVFYHNASTAVDRAQYEWRNTIMIPKSAIDQIWIADIETILQ